MSRFLIEKYRKLKPYTPGEQPKAGQQLIKLNTNESPFPPGPKTQAALGGEGEKLRLYPNPEGAGLKEAIAKRYLLQKENIFTAAGSDDILNFAFMAFAGEGGKVYFPEISYGFYQVFAELCGANYVKVPLKEDFTIDADDYACRDGMIVIANPNAPTGCTLPLYRVEEIVRTNPEQVVVIDEAYVDFGGESAANLVYKYENLLVVQTFSKSRSLAGARLGFAMASAALIGDLEKLRFSTNPYNISRLTEAAGVAAMEEEAYYMENCRKIMENREYTAQKLTEMGFSVIPSQANFLFAKSDKIGGAELYRRLREKGILIRHFEQEKIKDYNRITIGTREEMDSFLSATAEILREKL